MKQTAYAVYLHNGIDKMLESWAKAQLPVNFQDLIIHWSLYGKIIAEKRVEYTWTF